MQDVSVGPTIRRISQAFQTLNLSFHVTGGIVSSYYGVPRFTMDVDVVVLLERGYRDLPAVVAELEHFFDIDLESARESLRTSGMFQALDRESLHKVDFYSGERVPGAFSRTVVVELFPEIKAPVLSAEDCVISKLLWSSMGSGTSWKDALQVVRRQKHLDLELMRSLSKELDLEIELDRLMGEAHS